ncbi:hypothetical protein [Amycolatopsis benzoatilytica]|uniref:hypothetical protein n=1 Tax=Amycolatopsis benzoatilytica TaxID=346045 RepID=UPI00047F93B2|nr:hypothetical protein [Amycolatopsis benzoatilytica]
MKRWGTAAVFVAAGVLLTGCQEVDSAVGKAGEAKDKASACVEALGLSDLNPLVDADKLKARAHDKEQRLRQLATDVKDENVKNALLGMADSYVQVQKERIEDAGVVARWTKRNLEKLDALRKACT